MDHGEISLSQVRSGPKKEIRRGSEEVGGMADMGIIGVCLLLSVCAVVLALLLIAGDVEINPGPTGKEGS